MIETPEQDDSDESVEPYAQHLDTDADELMHTFGTEWLLILARDDVQALSIVLRFTLVSRLGLPILRAASVTGEILGKSERTIREWWSSFIDNDYTFSGTLQSAYQRSGVLWSSEELNEKVVKYVRENAAVKGHPNMTVTSFTSWINSELLPSQVLEPGFPRKVEVEASRKWLHELGFFIVDRKKGIYYDGYKRKDVLAYRKKFL